MKLDQSRYWFSQSVELFPLDVSDVGDAYVGWMNDPAVLRFLESRFSHNTAGSLRQFVVDAQASTNQLLLGIRSLGSEGGRHVGNIKIGLIDWNHGIADVGVMLGDRTAWGHGIASCAIRLACGIAHRDLELRKLTAGCYATNLRSLNAFERAGFVVEARRKSHVLLGGRPEDVCLLGKLLVEPDPSGPLPPPG